MKGFVREDTRTNRHLHAVFAVVFVSNGTLTSARRGQDARQRRRLTETQRLHPGVHGRLPPGRLYLPLLRLHVSVTLEIERKEKKVGYTLCWLENASIALHPPCIRYSNVPHFFLHELNFETIIC